MNYYAKKMILFLQLHWIDTEIIHITITFLLQRITYYLTQSQYSFKINVEDKEEIIITDIFENFVDKCLCSKRPICGTIAAGILKYSNPQYENSFLLPPDIASNFILLQ